MFAVPAFLNGKLVKVMTDSLNGLRMGNVEVVKEYNAALCAYGVKASNYVSQQTFFLVIHCGRSFLDITVLQTKGVLKVVSNVYDADASNGKLIDLLLAEYFKD